MSIVDSGNSGFISGQVPSRAKGKRGAHTTLRWTKSWSCLGYDARSIEQTGDKASPPVPDGCVPAYACAVAMVLPGEVHKSLPMREYRVNTA